MRGRRGPGASSSKLVLENDDAHLQSTRSASELDETGHAAAKAEVTLQGLLEQALGGAKNIERENETLRKQVKVLRSKLDRVQQADDVVVTPRRTRRVSASISSLQNEVQQLTTEVQRLEKSNEKYRKKNHELSMREIKSEANDLAIDDAEFEVGDSAHTMRKLLREFHDLMAENSLDEGEECPVCMERLLPEQCHSFPCEHTFCDDCSKLIRPDPHQPEVEAISCPTCRSVCLREELELVEHTATSQWDALLKIAKRWAKIDVRRAEDTSDEEALEEFIDDGTTNDTSTAASDSAPANPLESSPEAEAAEMKVKAEAEAEAGVKLEAGEGTPQPSHRLRKRRATSPSASPGPAENHPDGVYGEQNASTSATVDKEEVEQPRTPPPEAGPSTRRPSYAQTPTKDKRKRLLELAEARSKKRRL